MLLAQDDKMVHTLATDRSDQPLSIAEPALRDAGRPLQIPGRPPFEKLRRVIFMAPAPLKSWPVYRRGFHFQLPAGSRSVALLTIWAVNKTIRGGTS